LVSSGGDEGGVNGVEYIEGEEEEDVHSEYCCSVTASDGSSAELTIPLQAGGCTGVVAGGGAGCEDDATDGGAGGKAEVDATALRLLR
jgi:hypothetical protein